MKNAKAQRPKNRVGLRPKAAHPAGGLSCRTAFGRLHLDLVHLSFLLRDPQIIRAEPPEQQATSMPAAF